MLLNEALAGHIIGAAIEVHRELGPGLLESAYEACLCHELKIRKLSFQRHVPMPLVYKLLHVECGYRADLIIEDKVIVELKTVEAIADIHKAPLLTYLRIIGLKIGLIFNFNSPVLKDGLVRLVL